MKDNEDFNIDEIAENPYDEYEEPSFVTSNKKIVVAILLTLSVSLSLPLGAYEKIKDYLSITTGAVETRILNGDLDPSASSGVAAPIGSEYLRDNGDSFNKVGSADTEWIRQLNTSTPVGLELMEDPSFEKSVSSYCVSDNTAPFLTSNTSLKSPNNKKGTRINLRESGVTNYTCTMPVSAAYEGTPIRHKGWLTLWSAGNFSCSIVAQWNGDDVGNAQIITSSQNIYYDLEVIPTGAGTTGFKLSCDNPTANATYFVIHDETSNKAEKISPVLANISMDTDWQSFTPVSTWTSNVTWTGKKRRDGVYLELEITGEITGTPTVSSELSFDLPDNLIHADVFGVHLVGQGSLRDSSPSATYFASSYIGAFPNKVTLRGNNLTSGIIAVSQALNSNSFPFAWASGDYITLRARIPIKGWSATSPTIVMQNETFNSDLHLGAWVAQPNTATCSSAVIDGEANVGKWATCRRAASSPTLVGCDGSAGNLRPTQSDSGARTNGIHSFNKPYNQASTCLEPSIYHVNIGKNLSPSIKVYGNTSRSIVDYGNYGYLGNTVYEGLPRSYNPFTGILTVRAHAESPTVASSYIPMNDGSIPNNGYLVINASKNPAMSGVNAPASYIVKRLTGDNVRWAEIYSDCWVRQGGQGVGTGAVQTRTYTYLVKLAGNKTPEVTLTSQLSQAANMISLGGYNSTDNSVSFTDGANFLKTWSVEYWGNKTAIQALGVDTSKCQ